MIGNDNAPSKSNKPVLSLLDIQKNTHKLHLQRYFKSKEEKTHFTFS
jgi:hypothetical protein